MIEHRIRFRRSVLRTFVTAGLIEREHSGAAGRPPRSAIDLEYFPSIQLSRLRFGLEGRNEFGRSVESDSPFCL